MARLAVLLLLASTVALVLADTPSAEVLKYKEHDKHHDKEHKDYGPSHNMDEYKKHEESKHYNPKDNPPGYKHNAHYEKPRSYEPYPPPAYSHDMPYPSHGDGYGKPYPTYGSEGYGYGYEGTPSPYEGGYWGGSGGRQVIRLEAVYPEDLLNTTLINPSFERWIGETPPPQVPCTPEFFNGEERNGRSGRNGRSMPGVNPFLGCVVDFGAICALKHPEKSYGYDAERDYASRKNGPIIEGTPMAPVALGRGYLGGSIDIEAPLLGINLVTLNKNQRGYRIGEITGFINFVEGANACHPLLGPNTQATFTSGVPVYLMFTKIEIPVDPAWLLPLGGIFIGGDKSRVQPKAQVMGETEYKTMQDGTKYVSGKDYAYVLNEKSNALCGLSLVAKGPATVTVSSTVNMMPTTDTYTGDIEFSLLWTDLITTLPLLIQDPVDPPTDRSQRIFGSQDVLLERLAVMCKNNEIPYTTPGSITFDVSPSTA